MSTALGGRAAFITGGGSGLGEATARTLARAGAAVAVVDRSAEGARRVAEEIARAEGRALAVTCDVADEQSVAESVARAAEALGGVDIVVNCAATDRVVSVAEMSVELWDRALAVNLRGPFLTAKYAWPHMVHRGGGHIVNICSTAAVRAWGNAAAYHATKWGLRGFSRGLGVEGREHNIRVTVVIPGGMRTHWFDAFPEQGLDLPDERFLQDPANVAQTILFAVAMPHGSAVQEVIVTPPNETSWP